MVDLVHGTSDRMNPKFRNATGFTLLALLLALLGWDVWLYLDDVEGNTISEVMGGFSTAGLLVAFLAGHWWPQQGLLARIWTKDLSTLSLTQLRDMRTTIDKLIYEAEAEESG